MLTIDCFLNREYVTWRLEVKMCNSSRLIAEDTSQGHLHQTDARLEQLNIHSTVRQRDRQTDRQLRLADG